MDPQTASAFGTPVLERLLDYGALGILIIILIAWGYLERRRGDRLEREKSALEAEMRQMMKDQTPLMTGLIKQGDRVERALEGITGTIQSVKEAFATLRAEFGRGGQQ